MIRSLRTGVSGLKSNQLRMDVVGNNIANVNTVAFKRSRAAFQETLGQQLLGVGRTRGGSGINPAFVGLGVQVGSVDQNWSQGALETTNISTDLAINGDGFFVARSDDQQLLTRAGNFTFNRSGELVTATGMNVQGWPFQDDQLVTGALQDIKLDINATAPPKASENVFIGGNLSADMKLIRSTEIELGGQLDPAVAPPDRDVELYDQDGNAVAATIRMTSTGGNTWDLEISTDGGTTWGAAGNVDLDANPGSIDAGLDYDSDGTDDYTLKIDTTNLTVSTSGTSSISSAVQNADPKSKTAISTVVYDSAGRAHTMLVEFRRIDNNEWKFQVKDFETGAALEHDDGSGTMISDFDLAFNPDGTLNTTLSHINDNFQLDIQWDMEGDGVTEGLTLNLQGETNRLIQSAGSTTATVQEQDGYPSGSLEGFGINQEGVLNLNFSNGQQVKLFQLAIGQVNNPNGLAQAGENFYQLTSASGELQLGRGGRDTNTNVVAGTLEMSNVDLATEFTDMMITQRGFQAAARVITTSDELLQETVQLKR